MPALLAPLLLLAGETLLQSLAGKQNYICGSLGAHLLESRCQIPLRELRKLLSEVRAPLLLAGESLPQGDDR
jgi:hypothetical protein